MMYLPNYVRHWSHPCIDIYCYKIRKCKFHFSRYRVTPQLHRCPRNSLSVELPSEYFCKYRESTMRFNGSVSNQSV